MRHHSMGHESVKLGTHDPQICTAGKAAVNCHGWASISCDIHIPNYTSTAKPCSHLCHVLSCDRGAEVHAGHGLAQAHQCLQLANSDAVRAVAARRGIIAAQALEGAHQRGLGLHV
jgi:hypothetical protein